jgi:hypothetical protein
VSYAWWQLTLQLVINVFLAAGATGLVMAGWRALRGPTRTRRRAKPLALASLGALTVGGVSLWLTKELREPWQSFVSTPTRFSSDALGVTVDAPPGWRLEHEGATLTAIPGEQGVDEAPANFVLTSMTLEEETALERQLESFKQGLKRQGLTVHDSFQDSIAGQPASGFVADGDRASLSNWMVKRGPRWVLMLQCITRDGTDPRAACAAVRERLSLRTPSDPKARQ